MIGWIFEIEDYKVIGQLVKDASLRNCQDRRFAVLEGGYNHNVLGKNVKSLLEGFIKSILVIYQFTSPNNLIPTILYFSRFWTVIMV
jgi:acetoin utilization deacetylase AcuC-like enzyme